jgi:hypothetical protein
VVVVILATSVITPVISAIIALVVTAIIHAVVTPVIAVVTPVIAVVTPVIPVVVIDALGLLRGRRDPKGTLQLLALPHGMLSVTVELALVVHDHVKVTFEEGGRSWWICHVGFTRSLARPVPFIIVVFAVEVMHHRFLSVD